MTSARRRTGAAFQGYTLIVVLLVLVVVATLGFVFLGIINRNIQSSTRQRQTNVATDLAQAGIRYAHAQLLFSLQGADWRGAYTAPVSPGDPDYGHIKGGNPVDPDDRPGPDGLGFYTRVQFQSGRALIRVRYAPSDAAVFQTNPSGALREPGLMRNFLIIEAIGKPGRILANDPTVTGANTRGESRKLIAFASVGIIESARFITNKYRTSRSAEIGVPTELGAVFDTTAVAVPQIMGVETTRGGQVVRFGGSLYSNADLKVYGTLQATVNKTLGDRIDVNGVIEGADANASLELTRSNGDDSDTTGDAVVVLQNGTGLSSRDVDFSTQGGVLRDGIAQIDREGWSRGVGRKDPPSILATDPNTGLNRYVTMTRDSGEELDSGNSGRWGHGRNVYVNNVSDRQMARNEDGRQDAGANESLVYDWLNPNNGQANSAWIGPYYVPRGAFIELTYDGFTITRDSRGSDKERTWRGEDGVDSALATIRYRIGNVDTDGVGPLPPAPYIVNTLTPGVDIETNLTEADYARGFPFEGVLLFDGNVRVRGVVPEGRQLTLVSMGTIYIEGSITKMEDSAVALLAKDYVAVNTTQFFGPALGQTLEQVAAAPGTPAWNPLRVRTPDGTLRLRHELLRDPLNGTPLATQYRQFATPAGNTGDPITTSLLLSHTMDDGAASNAFFSLDVNFGLGATPTYLFELSAYNAATPYYPPASTHAGIYGLGDMVWQRYPKFESQAFPYIDATFVNTDPVLTGTGAYGTYELLLDESNYLAFRSNNVGPGSTNDYLLARAAAVPHDVRIEAAIYAEEGCFFVIPGQWFNPDPNDRRDTYSSLGLNDDEREQARRETFGAFPDMPFYGEPPDIRIQVIGAVAENMPPPISQQAEWLKKWGWIPRELGATNQLIPWHHVPNGYDVTAGDLYVPNLTITYDLDLASGRAGGFDTATYLRTDSYGRALPPMPRLPVSPSLAYFGEVNP